MKCPILDIESSTWSQSSKIDNCPIFKTRPDSNRQGELSSKDDIKLCNHNPLFVQPSRST